MYMNFPACSPSMRPPLAKSYSITLLKIIWFRSMNEDRDAPLLLCVAPTLHLCVGCDLGFLSQICISAGYRGSWRAYFTITCLLGGWNGELHGSWASIRVIEVFSTVEHSSIIAQWRFLFLPLWWHRIGISFVELNI